MAWFGMDASAQEAGVRLEVSYKTDYMPGLALVALEGRAGAAYAAAVASDILLTDLDYSDSFKIVRLQGVTRKTDARLEASGVVWVVSGSVEADGPNLRVRVELYDAVYQMTRAAATFTTPSHEESTFPMAVHAIADEIHRWATGTPGMAATRIVYVRANAGESELYVVDSDGSNQQQITFDRSLVLSPAWSPDSDRIAYTSFKKWAPWLYELDLRTGTSRLLASGDGINSTPAYLPSGGIVYSATDGWGTALYRAVGGRNERLVGGRGVDAISPSISPDGGSLVFVSNVSGAPEVYAAPLGAASRGQQVSEALPGRRPYAQGPDWSPLGDLVVYHTRNGEDYQIVIKSMKGPERRYLTNVGRNEDPSWAPDGRHVVFSSDTPRPGLYVIDRITGRRRLLVQGDVGLPDWSNTMVRLTSN